MIGKEWFKIRLSATEEAAHVKGERTGQRKKDDNKDECHRRRKIALQLAFRDDPDITHHRPLQ